MKITSVISLAVLICFKGNCQDGIIGKINNADTIKGRIDSITTSILHPDSKFAYAQELDQSSPNGLYAVYRADTIMGKLRMVIYYTYNKKILNLFNYYYYNDKLIKVTEYRDRLRTEREGKVEKFERTLYYWNDTWVVRII